MARASRVKKGLSKPDSLPSGTVTFLFTDIEGSTQRWETHRAEMALAVARHEKLMRAAVSNHGGFVFKTVGDAFCVAFRQAQGGLDAAPADVGVRTENQLAAWFSDTLPGPSASGLSHVMGKQIGARHAIPHGVTSCLLMPHVMRYVARSKPDRMALVAAATGSGKDGADDVQRLITSLGLPQHIADFGIGEPELRRAADELGDRYPAKDVLEIYLAAL